MSLVDSSGNTYVWVGAADGHKVGPVTPSKPIVQKVRLTVETDTGSAANANGEFVVTVSSTGAARIGSTSTGATAPYKTASAGAYATTLTLTVVNGAITTANPYLEFYVSIMGTDSYETSVTAGLSASVA